MNNKNKESKQKAPFRGFGGKNTTNKGSKQKAPF
jgi:hypothetical protein